MQVVNRIPKVSIITSTWQRHEQLLRAISSIRSQTFIDWEHIIISDGFDQILEDLLKCQPWWNYKYLSLGRNWRSFSGGLSPGASPKLVGTYIAAGDYIAYLDDDNAWLPHHLEVLVREIESKKVDWVYSKIQVINHLGMKEEIIGDGVPRHAAIDTNIVLHKVALIKKTNWKVDFYEDDWKLVQEWLKQGYSFSWADNITAHYYRRQSE